MKAGITPMNSSIAGVKTTGEATTVALGVESSLKPNCRLNITKMKKLKNSTRSP